MFAGAQCTQKHVQPKPPSSEATTWVSVPIEDEDRAEYFKTEDVEEEEHVESLSDCSVVL